MAETSRPGWKMVRIRPETHERLCAAARRGGTWAGSAEPLDSVVARALDALHALDAPASGLPSIGPMFRPVAQGMQRARDGATGTPLCHTRDGGRLYIGRVDGYLFCATCDACGRDPYVAHRDAEMEGSCAS